MTQDQIQSTLQFLQEKYEREKQSTLTSIEAKMLEREYNKNVEMTMAGNNIFRQEDSESDYECIGCGA
jgi:hypothetical protein